MSLIAPTTRDAPKHGMRLSLIALAAAVLAGLAACSPAADEAEAPAAPAATIEAPLPGDGPTALDAYIAKPDPAFKWARVGGFDGEGFTAHVLQMTSQAWRSPAEVDRSEWEHWITVVVPDEIRADAALLYIGGGDNGDPMPQEASDRARRIAVETGTVVAELGMVPNQPLFFTDTPDKARYEDDLIAYTRVKHFISKDDEWLVRLAMVKSGVKAMDAVQAFMASPEGGGRTISRFAVAGGSKRGWTTWLVGAVDERVVAIMPLVIDALNSEEITRHHYEVLGFFAPSLGDYVHHGLFPHKIGSPDYRAVLDIEDPYVYRNRERMKMPKFIVNASGDQYFHPDNSRFYYDGLKEEKRLRYVPNAAHNLEGSDAIDSVIAFYDAVIHGRPRPGYAWETLADGALKVTVEAAPSGVRLWKAHNPQTRDFRVEHLGNAYAATELTPEADGSYIARVEAPTTGFAAWFVEIDFPSGGPHPFKFTTPVTITPDVTPHRWEDAAAQYAETLGGEAADR